MKKVLFAVLFMVMGAIVVNASTNSAVLNYSGPSEVMKGDIIRIDANIADIKGEDIAGMGAEIVFDPEYLELVSFTSMEKPFTLDFNYNTRIFAGISFTGEGIRKDQAVLALEFKALKAGQTTISFKDEDLASVNANSAICISKDKTITIKEKKVEEEKVQNVDIKNEEIVKPKVENKTIVKDDNTEKISYDVSIFINNINDILNNNYFTSFSNHISDLVNNTITKLINKLV